MLKRFLFSTAALVALSALLPAGAGAGAETDRKKAEAAAKEIIEMRSDRARAFIEPDTEITVETFKKVCGAVGKRVKEISRETGFTIRHASTKYRNPDHKATPNEAVLIKRFSEQKKLASLWDKVKKDGAEYRRYTRPIFVEEACLACHGPKERRPEFIKKKYPGDRAYGYKAGDLRGINSVMVPTGK